MERKEKLATIYEKVANKELTFGCKIITNEYNWDEFRVAKSGLLAIKEWEAYRTVGCDCCSEDLTIKEVIGHPVMIGDVMDYLEDISRSQFDDEEDEEYFYSREEYYEDIAELSDCWGDKRLCIDEQSEECIDLVYSLIEKL